MTHITSLHHRLLAMLLCFILLAPVTAQAVPRGVALVIGNAQYAERPLKNPVNDARDLAAALKKSGFEVMLKQNLTADQMKEAIADFGDRLARERSVGLFYFSGHGMQTSKGQNFLLPVGRDYKRERDVEFYAVEARSVLNQMEAAGNPLNIVVLDACRDAPLPAEARSTSSKGLARMEAPSGSIIAFATAPGRTASDNPNERNGLYTKHLIAAINTPGLRLEDVFKRVGRNVERDSNRQQSPEEMMKLRDDTPFFFIPDSQSARTAPSEPSSAAMELAFWQSTQQNDTSDAYEAYLEQYPVGRFAKLAKSALARLKAANSPQPATQLTSLRPPAPPPQPTAQPAQPGLCASVSACDSAFGRAQANKQNDGMLMALWGKLYAQQQAGDAREASATRRYLVAAATQFYGPKDPRVDSAERDDVTTAIRKVANAAQREEEQRSALRTRYLDGIPKRMVNIPGLGIQMGRYEVTQGEWISVMGNNPSFFQGCEDCPVENVSWDNIQDYLKKLNQLTGQQYRLPTEAEWKHACDGGREREYCGSDNLDAVGWYSGNSGGNVHPVGQKQANGYGLYDMSGNVFEWMQDCYDGDCSVRVQRGGSWIFNTVLARAAYRDRGTLAFRGDNYGFRVVRSARTF